MFHLEDHKDLITRLDLPEDSELMGYSLWYKKGEKSGFIHDFDFKFTTANATEHSFAYSLTKRIMHGMNLDKCIYDFETITMIQHIFNWYTAVAPEIHYVLSIFLNENERRYHTTPVRKILC